MLHLVSDSNVQAAKPESLRFLLSDAKTNDFLGEVIWSPEKGANPVPLFRLMAWQQLEVGSFLASFFSDDPLARCQLSGIVAGVFVLCPERGL